MIWPDLLEVVLPLFVGVPGGIELAVVLLLVVLLFGPHKLPQLARSVGKAEAEFQKSRHEAVVDLEDTSHRTEPLLGQRGPE